MTAYDKALADYSEAIRLNPQAATAFNNRGVTYADLKACAKALADYNEAIHLNPQYAGAFYNRACAHALQGQLEQVLPALRRAFELDQAADSTRLVDLARNDADFDLFRTEPAFQALLAEFSA